MFGVVLELAGMVQLFIQFKRHYDILVSYISLFCP